MKKFLWIVFAILFSFATLAEAGRDVTDSGDKIGRGGDDWLNAYPVSMSVWVKFNTTNTNRVLMAAEQGQGILSGDWQGVHMPDVTSQVRCGSSNGSDEGTASTPSSTVTTGVWYHIFCRVGAANDREIYVNGSSEGTDSTSVTMNTDIDETEVGAEQGFAGGECDCLFGEAAFWTADLSQNEITALSQGASPWSVRSNSLAVYWPLYGAGSSEADNSGNQRNATLTGVPQANHPPTTFMVPGYAY